LSQLSSADDSSSPTAHDLNTHDVAQSIAPDCRVVYVDNDPIVLAHARALLTNTTPEGVITYVDADVRDIETIVSDARNVLNFKRFVRDAVVVLIVVLLPAPAVPPGSRRMLRSRAAIHDAGPTTPVQLPARPAEGWPHLIRAHPLRPHAQTVVGVLVHVPERPTTRTGDLTHRW
jgi:hypothetical protein